MFRIIALIGTFAASTVGRADSAFVFVDRDLFVTATGAIVSTEPYPVVSGLISLTSGDIEFTAIQSSTLRFGSFPADFPDDNDIELALSGDQNLDIRRVSGAVHAMGIEFQTGGSNTSTFTVSARSGDEELSRFVFEAPAGTSERFIGMWSREPFDTLRIRETPTANEDEYFGTVFASIQPPPVGWQKVTAADAAPAHRFGVSVSLSGDQALIGADSDDELGVLAGAAYLFERAADGQWTQIDKLIASDAGPGDWFGSTVSLDGDRALIGAYLKDNEGAIETGSAYLFERLATGQWEETAKLTADDATPGDQFGLGISLDGNRALIGAGRDDDRGSEAGSAYLFERQPDGQWQQIVKLTAAEAAPGDRFGTRVSLDGDRALVGARGDSERGTEAGAAYLFERTLSGQWEEVEKLTAGNAAPEDRFGSAVSLSGDHALIGAYRNDEAGRDAGAAYLFERGHDKQWRQVCQLTAADAAPGDGFGLSVSLDGHQAIVGAFRDDDGGNDSGSIYVFQRGTDGEWRQIAKRVAPDGAAGDNFGLLLSLNGGSVLSSAYRDDDGNSNSGSAYLWEYLLFGDGFEAFNRPMARRLSRDGGNHRE